MFEDSLLNGSQTLATRRTASMMASVGVQAILLTTLAALPLFTSERLPVHRWMTAVVPFAPPRGVPETYHQAAQPATSNAATIVTNTAGFQTPPRIPRTIDMSAESEPSRYAAPWGVIGGDPNGRPDGVLNSIFSSAGPPPPTPPPTAPPRRLLISHYNPGMVIRQVKPVYPHTALITHTGGAVVLRAIVGKDGSVQDLRVISGSPLLVGSALEAVRQWQFRPYLLNGSPIEIETQVTVNFVINR